MLKNILLIVIAVIALVSCKPTRKIQTAIAKKDTVEVTVRDTGKEDSMRFISQVFQQIQDNYIGFNTFSAKLDLEYIDADDKKYDVNAFLRMQKDSAIWISVNAIFGIEALRVLVTRDSLKILDKQNKIYTARTIHHLQDVAALPLDLATLQDLLIGNPIFLDSIASYTQNGDKISLLVLGDWFKNLLTVHANDKSLERIKLDDTDLGRSRTCDLTYSEYENKKGVRFSTRRKITVAEKKKLDIRLEFKQYEFGEALTFPFNIPKNYKTQ